MGGEDRGGVPRRQRASVAAGVGRCEHPPSPEHLNPHGNPHGTGTWSRSRRRAATGPVGHTRSLARASRAALKNAPTVPCRGGHISSTFSFTFKRLKPNSIGTMEPKTVTMKTKLESGVKHGTVKRMKGQGHDHPEGDAGDVLLTIRIDAGEGYYWDGDSLIQEVQTAYSTLMLGGKVKVKLPSGKEGLLTVPANTQVGDRRRMNGAGIQGGDLDLEFVLMETEELTEEQRIALEKLSKTGL